MPAHDEAYNREVIDKLSKHSYPTDGLKPADVVMKGGITSGVVYPLAVCELAKTYRFCNVGGSSAGGIAAAFAAAAETARKDDGFRRLAALPTELGKDLPKLFQPSRGTRPLFALFEATGGPWWRLLWVLLSGQWLGALAGFVFTTLSVAWSLMLAHGAPANGADWAQIARDLWPAALVIVLGTFLGAAVGAARAALHQLPRNGHGLCIGSNGAKPGAGTKPFTDWMHAKLSDVAGRPGAVLLFGDLWGEDAVKRYRDERTDTAERREPALRAARPDVRLEMMTTNVTQARPVRLPFVEDVYSYCEQELARWFPPDVMTALQAGGVALQNRFPDDDEPWHCPEHGTPLRKMPEPPDFPVIVAVRMSLSFPGLISAVPLWVVDYTAQDPAPVHCRFSDGGISSNFPIHFFDALLPSRPTFAISLGPYPPGRENEHVYYAGPGGAPPRVTPTDSLPRFASAIIDTLQNWSDNGQSRLPGYRDRVVEVRTAPDEGGINLNMKERTILDLAVRGRDAALALLDAEHGFKFDRHRKVRYRTALAELQDVLGALAMTFDSAPPGGPTYRELIGADEGPGVGKGAVRRIDTLTAFVPRNPDGTLKEVKPDMTRERPRPDPDLRIVPHF